VILKFDGKLYSREVVQGTSLKAIMKKMRFNPWIVEPRGAYIRDRRPWTDWQIIKLVRRKNHQGESRAGKRTGENRRRGESGRDEEKMENSQKDRAITASPAPRGTEKANRTIGGHSQDVRGRIRS
jgi:hypothetical protein